MNNIKIISLIGNINYLQIRSKTKVLVSGMAKSELEARQVSVELCRSLDTVLTASSLVTDPGDSCSIISSSVSELFRIQTTVGEGLPV